MPFDKKLACIANYWEKQSFPWPLVYNITRGHGKLVEGFGCFKSGSPQAKLVRGGLVK